MPNPGWYRTGTVTTTATTALVGVGTFWSSQVNKGDTFTRDNLTLYEVVSITDDTHITLDRAFTGTPGAGQSYAILRNFTNATNADVAARLTAFIAANQAFYSGPLIGHYADGSVGLPGWGYIADTSSGFYRIADAFNVTTGIGVSIGGANVFTFQPGGVIIGSTSLSLTGSLTVSGSAALNGGGSVTGNFTVPTQLTIDNSLKAANTTFVHAAISSSQASPTFSGLVQFSAAVVSPFAGGGQASATQLTAQVSRVATVVTAGDSIKLPAAAPGLTIFVSNTGANACRLFPFGTETINTIPSTVGVLIQPGQSMCFTTIGTTTWQASLTNTPFADNATPLGLPTQRWSDLQSVTATIGSLVTSGNAQFGGNVGIGMAPLNQLDITKNQNSATQISVLNNSAGNAALAGYLVNAVTASGGLFIVGAGFTTSGIFKANQTVVYANGGALTLATLSTQPVVFGMGNSEVARFDTTGNMEIGTTMVSGARLTVQPPVSSAYRSVQFLSGDSTNLMYSDTGDQSYTLTGMSAAHTAIFLCKHTVSGRSLSSLGTNNAAGADYAEYRELIAVLYGSVAKGALLGYDAFGLMTNVFADVVGRVLPKSTAPSYVGGDTWGTIDVICAAHGIAAPGSAPAFMADPGADATADEAEEYIAYVADFAAWSERAEAFDDAMEAERVKYDRIALCGVVPVNIAGLTSADVGKSLVPCAAPDGTITAVAKDVKANLSAAMLTNDITALGQAMMDYMNCFGTIEKIAADGRPMVNVKNG